MRPPRTARNCSIWIAISRSVLEDCCPMIAACSPWIRIHGRSAARAVMVARAAAATATAAHDLLLRNRLHPNPLRERVESRQVGVEHFAQAVGLRFQFLLQILEDRLGVSDPPALARADDRQQPGEAGGCLLCVV